VKGDWFLRGVFASILGGAVITVIWLIDTAARVMVQTTFPDVHDFSAVLFLLSVGALATVYSSLARLHRKVDRLLMNEQDLETKIAKLQSDVTAYVSTQQTTITDLRSQVAALTAGQPVTQEQLDKLGAAIDTVDAAVAPIAQ
jgi:outer membrane murein-binding lipoprotein Lpp